MRAWTVVGRADRAVAQLDAMQRAGLAVDADVYRALVQPHLMLLLDSADGLSPASAASGDSASTSGVGASAGSGGLVASVGSSAESKSSTATPVVASISAIPGKRDATWPSGPIPKIFKSRSTFSSASA